MAMAALNADECEEQLRHFRAGIPETDDSLLRELAGNFALDTLACFDLVDFQAVLNVPGQRLVLRGVIKDQGDLATSLIDLFPQWTGNAPGATLLRSALLVIKSGEQNWNAIAAQLWRLLEPELPPDAIVGGPVHYDPALRGETHLLLVLSGR